MLFLKIHFKCQKLIDYYEKKSAHKYERKMAT